jgi:ribosome-associated heat shock protein Hsp15
MPEKEKLRLDKYLWSIRLFKTRSEATDACAKGKVKYNGDAAKPSKTVSVGDEYEVKTEEIERLQYQSASFNTGKRQSKIGRPTKKQRRDLDGFMEE